MSTNGSSGPHELWRHSAPESTQIYHFLKRTVEKHRVPLNNYDDLWRWSISEPARFWEDVWLYTGVKAHKSYNHVSSIKVSTPNLRFYY